MERDLAGRVAVVTGGNSGVGRATSLLLAKNGVKVVVVGRRSEKCREAAAEIERDGGTALAVRADVGESSAVSEMIKKTVETFGTVDILVNSAGIGHRVRLLDLTDEEWDLVMRASLYGTFYCSREAYRVMKEKGRGHIVNIASVAAYWPGKDEICYGTAKAAQVKFSLHTHFEFQEGANPRKPEGAEGFFVHALLPGGINTPFWERVPSVPNRAPGRLEPEHIAGLILDILKNPDKGLPFFQELYRDGPVDLYAFDSYQKFPFIMSVGLKKS